ncbi:type II secretion system F family protein [Helicobacter sp. MIT 00-7814]|uniref:type II secretion system F family protein n=1 Tax=unclassified Helicobacter TaxID=2593540 RepID=UPI000E1ED1E0|nr:MULTISPECIES: type II secretion system F family protein [unclassified Helicobacter]RDU55902.1 type II secretion system F family protein [Helicobacter sp. MIT 00-7814]RDU56860.1 type II secretion system F family protein [Helicobacter sp. MIT 99-10781]
MQDFFSHFKTRIFSLQKASNKELSALFYQMALMLDSGVDLMECMRALQVQSPRLKVAMKDICERLQDGLSLEMAFARHREIFGNLACVSLGLGEKSGDLQAIASMLALEFSAKAELNAKTKKALLYPSVLLFSLIGAFVAIIYFVMPPFLELFNELRVELPIYTKILIWVANFIESFGLISSIFALGAIFTLRVAYEKTTHIKEHIDALLLRLPLFGKLIALKESYNFCFGLSCMLQGALSLGQSLRPSIECVQNSALKKRYEKLLPLLELSQPLNSALANLGLLDSLSLALLNVGEKSGRLGEILFKIAQNKKREYEEKVDILLHLLEPLLSLLMGGMILLLALGIFVPMWDMSASALA